MTPNRARLAAQIGALAALSAGGVQAQVLLDEGFSPPAPAICNTGGPYPYLPTGWTRYNVDNRVPASSVAYVNEAWIVREDFSFNVAQCAAFSTSWYSPAGAANDFLCTPALGPLPASTQLTWRAVTYDSAYRDGYEVRVMTVAPTGGTGAIGNLLSASSVVFSTAAEATSWTPHSVSLAPYAGQTVYVCFRNNSNDKFLLLVDDVKVAADIVDLAVTQPAPASEYTRVPFWNGQPIQRSATVGNVGSIGLTNVTLQAETKLDAGVVATDSSTPIATLAAGASQLVTIPGQRRIDAVGSWRVHYLGQSAQSANDATPANDSADSVVVVAGGDEIGRDDGVTAGTLGIGAGNGGELGQHFDLPTGGRARAIRYVLADVVVGPMDPPYPGGPVVAHLRAWDAAAGKPGALIASTTTFTASATGATVDADLLPGPVDLAAGRYVVTVEEPVTATLALALSTNNFTPGTTWVNWPTSPFGTWANNEQFGAGFAKSYRVSLLFGTGVFANGFEDPPPPAPPAATSAAAPLERPDTARSRSASRALRLSDAVPAR